MIARIAFVFVLVALLARPAWGRGGGGCLEHGTLILTPGGPVPVEQLAPGQNVFSVVRGELRAATVQACVQVEPDEFIELEFAGVSLRVTAEHPVQILPGVFRVAERLRVGDSLFVASQRGLKREVLLSVRLVTADRPAYNLLVTPGGTFVANGVVVHNKGCFLPDTPILRADGSQTAIRDVRPGEALLAFTPESEIVSALVRQVLTHEVEEFFVVRTGSVVLHVTAEHPFYVGEGTFKTLEALRVGDQVYAFDGRGLSAQRLVSLERVRAPTRVYNLQTDAPHTFFASGLAVHNKGGGCFPAGTMIRTPRGEVAIETLHAGDTVLAIVADGRTRATSVQRIYTARDAILFLETDRGELRTTFEHPLLTADGTFRPAGELMAGEHIVAWQEKQLQPATVLDVHFTGAVEPVFNLQVGAPHTFVAGGFVAHNKGGGCFPAGTMIRTPQGEVAIEKLAPGDSVLDVTDHDRLRAAAVRKIFTTRAKVLALETDSGTLRVSPEHPVRLADGGFREAGELAPGERLLVWQDGRLRPTALLRQASVGELDVFNLEVDAPHTFVADGFVVHNKGGGGGFGGGYHGGSSSGSGSSSMTPAEQKQALFILLGGAGFIALVVVISRLLQQRQENLDYVYSLEEVAAKAQKTDKLLQFISRVDDAFAPDKLREFSKDTFGQLQKCWQSRDYAPMKPLLMPDLYAEHCGQLGGMIRNHEINVIEDVHVERVDLVNVRYPHKQTDREFTALITARARDYYMDDRTRVFLRGDDAPALFQEFWTFQRHEGKWLLREIEQTRESDVLKDENFFEPFTDAGTKQVYGETDSPGGPAGPWLEKSTATKATRVEHLLNYLVTTDKLWDREAMLLRARQVFLSVYLAQESGAADQVPVNDLFPEAAADLQGQLAARAERGTALEFRNLCVRKVELILVRNFADNQLDEFTVRTSAHAQRSVKRNGLLISRDEYVTPFTEYWTFGRLGNQWKLKEVLPPARGETALTQENVDEASSPEQLQWYYQQTRAV